MGWKRSTCGVLAFVTVGSIPIVPHQGGQSSAARESQHPGSRGRKISSESSVCTLRVPDQFDYMRLCLSWIFLSQFIIIRWCYWLFVLFWCLGPGPSPCAWPSIPPFMINPKQNLFKNFFRTPNLYSLNSDENDLTFSTFCPNPIFTPTIKSNPLPPTHPQRLRCGPDGCCTALGLLAGVRDAGCLTGRCAQKKGFSGSFRICLDPHLSSLS